VIKLMYRVNAGYTECKGEGRELKSEGPIVEIPSVSSLSEYHCIRQEKYRG